MSMYIIFLLKRHKNEDFLVFSKQTGQTSPNISYNIPENFNILWFGMNKADIKIKAEG